MSLSDWGRGNPEDEDVEDINGHPEETSTIGRDTLSHHATPTHMDGRYSLHYTHGWSHVARPYPTYDPEPSSSHYTSSSPHGHPYPYQQGTPSPPVHTLPPQFGFIPSSSHNSTPSPPADVYPHDHGIRPSSSHHATLSPSGGPAHSPGVGDEHTSTSRRPPTPHRHSFARSSNNKLRSSIPQPLEEIPDFFRPSTAPADGENPLTYLIAEHGLLEEMSTQTPDTSIDKDAVYLEVVLEVKGRVYGLGSQGYIRSISSGGASSSRGPAYALHELEELQRDHQRLQETLLKERMERQ
ncbi:hypothetical protein Syun_019383 [Stephania yunnanensis]|uniref:Uncharacterized protein n=1 Tax=Stephania yunnanensis TaxID=152371 RepID=A0AAP0NZD4_9MAGN